MHRVVSFAAVLLLPVLQLSGKSANEERALSQSFIGNNGSFVLYDYADAIPTGRIKVAKEILKHLGIVR